jgi:hypothetical protein
LTKIDWNRPLETVEGVPVTFLRHQSSGTKTAVVRTEGAVCTNRGVVHPKGANFVFKDDGKHAFGSAPDIRNVAATAPVLDVTKQLQTVDGKKVSFLGRMEDGRIVISVAYATWSGQPATELRFADGRKSSLTGVTSGDDVIVKVVKTERYRNIYADGTMGSTVHDTEEAAKLRSQYGKVRVGVLHQTLEDGKLVRATMIAASPWFRSRGFPSGRAAVATDY